MKPRTKFLIGGALVLSAAGYLMASSIRETGVYYLTPTELNAKMTADPSFANAGIKVGARVVKGSIKRDPGGRVYDFVVTDGSHTFPVQYKGIAPDTFTDSVDVVIGGRMGNDGTFHANELLAKCASRYENAPENPANKYKQTPGYKAAAPSRS
jgi:cytochrome c-type biogenesis protein CcmE